MHELKGVLFVDSAVFQVNVLTQQREIKQSKSRNRNLQYEVKIFHFNECMLKLLKRLKTDTIAL